MQKAGDHLTMGQQELNNYANREAGKSPTIYLSVGEARDLAKFILESTSEEGRETANRTDLVRIIATTTGIGDVVVAQLGIFGNRPPATSNFDENVWAEAKTVNVTDYGRW